MCLTRKKSTSEEMLDEYPELFQFREVLDRTNHLAGVAVFVVVPSNDLYMSRSIAHVRVLNSFDFLIYPSRSHKA